ncbi:MAG TPA: hypothetical protein VKA34_19960 [Balneolales bacterium]|nr:hypothetical protein [Balneolales bacterium]
MSHSKLRGIRYIVGLVGVFLLFYACNDSTSISSIHTQQAVLTKASINPQKINFASINASKDTSVTITLTATVSDTSVLRDHPHYTVSDVQSDSTIARGTLTDFNPATSTYQTTYSLKIKTTDIAEYQIFIYGIDKQNKMTNTFRSTVTIYGTTGKPPVILSVNNPDTVQIPTGSNVNYFDFKAKATDPDGQNNIDSVLVNLVSKNSGKPLNGSPFQLFDDGGTQTIGNSNSGDVIKGDSVYTRRFQINSSNTPDKFTVSYYAVDKTGLHSDTTVTHLVFVK